MNADTWRAELEDAFKNCLVGRWFYFEYKKSKEKSSTLIGSNLIIPEADSANYMSLYEYLSIYKLNANNELNYSISSIEQEDEDAIVNDTIENNESYVNSSLVNSPVRAKNSNSQNNMCLMIEKLKL